MGLPSSRAALVLVPLLALVLSCAGTFRGDARTAAEASYITYVTLAPAWAQVTADLEKKQAAHTLTPEQTDRLLSLRKLGYLLESYRLAHQTFIKSLSVTDRARLVDLLNQVIDLGLSLQLTFHAVRMSP